MNKFTILSIATIGLHSISTHAGIVSAELWKLSDTDTYIANPATVPVSQADVTFDSPTPFNYSAEGSVAQWLASGGALSIVENTGGTLASAMSDGEIGTVVRFTGCITVQSDQTFTFLHDDGMYLAINGLDLGFLASPTSPLLETKSYTGPSGTFDFLLVYTENHSGPAVLVGREDGFTTCPDTGSSLALMSCALTAIGTLARRTRR